MPSHHALHALKWSALGNAASRVIGPLVFLVLARLLVPGDFGVVAAATVVISFSQLFVDAGLAKALIQRQDRPQECATAVFWLNLAFGTLVAALLFATAGWVATWFHDARIAAVVRVLSLQVVLTALGSVHTALLQKELAFKRLFWVRLLTTAIPGLASIPLALNGFGYWALVAGSLAGQLAQCVLLWRASDWRPAGRVDRLLAKELLGFGKWAMLSGLLGWFYLWMDATIVGHYLGAHDMGLYRTGNTLVMMLFGLVFSPTLPVLYSLFSRQQHDLPGLRAALTTVIHAIALIALPLGCFLFVSADALADFVFGPAWIGIGDVIGILAVMHAVSWLVGANGEVYRAIGKPHVETWVNLVMLPVYLAVYLLAIRMGLKAFLDARLALAVLALAAHILVARHVLRMPASTWWFLGIVIVSVCSAFVVAWVKPDLGSPVFNFTAMAVLFGGLVVAGLMVVERDFLLRLAALVQPRSTVR